MPRIARRAFGRPVVDQPRAAVRIDEQRRVDPVEIEPVRRGPRPGRVARGDIEIAAARDAGGEDVKAPVMILDRRRKDARSEEHTSELQSLMRISYAVFCLTKKKKTQTHTNCERDTHYKI